MATFEQVVRAYRQLRDQKKELEQHQKEEKKVIQDKMSILETWLIKNMQNQGTNSIATDEGTAYLSEPKSVTTSDGSAFLEYVIANEYWSLLDARPNKTAVEEHIAEHGCAPPGVNVSAIVRANVRRK